MAKLSASEIASVAKAAGLATDVDIAVAIALAESGGNTQAHNALPPDDSYGLWQINMLGSMGPQRRRQLGISRNSDLYDPATNARAMMMISNGGKNWRPWTTYTRGTYKMYMGQAGTAAPGTTVPVAGGSGSLNRFADRITDKRTWTKFGTYVLGFLLIIIGVVLIVGTGKLNQVTGMVQKVAEVKS